jgi:hypothetical protein
MLSTCGLINLFQKTFDDIIASRWLVDRLSILLTLNAREQGSTRIHLYFNLLVYACERHHLMYEQEVINFL